MFLTITFLPYGLPQILLHILNEHDEYFQMIYSLLGNSMIRILHIRRSFLNPILMKYPYLYKRIILLMNGFHQVRVRHGKST